MTKNIIKFLLLGLVFTILSGCEAWTTGEHPQVTAIKTIAEYADNNDSTEPDAGLYKDAGISIDSEDINKTNTYIRTLTSKDVDTQEEIQEIVDNIDTLALSTVVEEVVVEVENIKPIAKINLTSDAKVVEGEIILLDAIGSTDSDGEIVKYEWKEDGKLLHSGIGYDAKLSVKRHIIELVVTDNDGGQGKSYISVEVISADSNTSN